MMMITTAPPATTAAPHHIFHQAVWPPQAPPTVATSQLTGSGQRGWVNESLPRDGDNTTKKHHIVTSEALNSITLDIEIKQIANYSALLLSYAVPTSTVSAATVSDPCMQSSNRGLKMDQGFIKDLN